MACSECGAQRGHLLGCSHAEELVRQPAPAFLLTEHEAEQDERAIERRRLWAFPAVYLAAWALVSTDLGAFIGRTCFGMWLHELGHTLAAWLCGQWAVPSPWFTWTFGRSPLVTVAVFGAFGALLWHGLKRKVPWMVATGAALLAVAAGCHLLRESSQELFFTFAGEAGAMLFGAALSTAFLLPPTVRALRGGLRWGWLVIGALSWADATHLWVLARRDWANLPFGLENGIESDATKLVERFHWDEGAMVSGYLAIAAVTLAGAMLAWAFTVKSSTFPQAKVPSRSETRS